MRRLRLFREAQTFRFSVVEIEVELRRRSRLGDLGNLCRLPRSLQISSNRRWGGQRGNNPLVGVPETFGRWYRGYSRATGAHAVGDQCYREPIQYGAKGVSSSEALAEWEDDTPLVCRRPPRSRARIPQHSWPSSYASPDCCASKSRTEGCFESGD
jgi:hypothetical protein